MISEKRSRRIIPALCLILTFQLACRSPNATPEVIRTVKTGKRIDDRFLAPREYVTFSPDRTSVAATIFENSVLVLHLWSVETGKEIFSIAIDDKGDYVFGEDNRTIALKLKEEVRVLSVIDGSWVHSYPVDVTPDVIYRLLSSAKELFLLTLPSYFARSPSHSARLWRLSGMTPAQEFDLHQKPGMTEVALSRDGTLLALGYGGISHTDVGPDQRTFGIDIFSVADGKLLRSLYGHRSGVMRLCFSNNSRLLASGGSFGDGRLVLWRMSDGTRLAEISVQEPSRWQKLMSRWKNVRSIDFSADGQAIAFGGSDGNIYVINTADGKSLKTFTNQSEIFGVGFAPDRNEILSWDHYGAITTWKL
jgi:WD40 repeat protein